jgi:hypothetical protein
MTRKPRDYAKEYRDYQGTEEQKKRRAERNKDRRAAIRKYGKEALQGKEVDHLGSDPHGDLGKRKTKIVSKHANRIRQPKRT